MCTRAVLLMGIVGLLSTTDAQELRRGELPAKPPAAADMDAEKVKEAAADPKVEEKREWLRATFVAPMRGGSKRKLYNARLDRMTPQQVNQLFDHYQRVAAEQRRRQGMRVGRRPVGFSPVVTWLPSGANLGVGAVVSPDRRNVRISVNPFFSNVPYYDTFNLRNGNTRRYYIQPPRSVPHRTVTRATPTPRRSTVPSRQTPSWYNRVRNVR